MVRLAKEIAMADSRSREALLEFLEYLSRKGLANKSTVSARKAAVSRILGILDESEAADVTDLDLEAVMHRFANLEGDQYTPDSLTTYKSRTKSAIDDFVRYLENPMGFKSGRKPSKRLSSKSESNKREVVSGQAVSEARSFREPVDFLIPIPIRENVVVYLRGVPYDLSVAEANKIAAVIKAMAHQD